MEGWPHFHLPQKLLAEGKWHFRGTLATAPFLTRATACLRRLWAGDLDIFMGKIGKQTNLVDGRPP